MSMNVEKLVGMNIYLFPKSEIKNHGIGGVYTGTIGPRIGFVAYRDGKIIKAYEILK